MRDDPGHQGPQHGATTTDRDALARALHERHAQLTEQLARAEEESDPDTVDEPHALAQVELARSRADVVRAQLVETEAALERTKHADAGICARCGVVIPMERLLALPATTTCSRCAV